MINRISGNFTIVSNAVLDDKTLSLKAKGLYCFLNSKSPDWQFSYSGLYSQLLDGEKRIRSAMKELVEKKLVIRFAVKSDNNFNGYEWIINPTEDDLKNYVDPFDTIKNKVESTNQGLFMIDNAQMGNSPNGHALERHGINNTKEVNTEEVNTNKVINKKTIQKESETNKIFEIFRQTYPGTKRGLTIELKEMQRHKDWTECLDLLLPALEKEIAYKKTLEKKKVFVPQWKNLSTWIKQRCWEQEFATIDDGKLEFERDSDGKYSEYF